MQPTNNDYKVNNISKPFENLHKIPSAEKYGAPESEWFAPSIKFFFASRLAIFKIAF
jgi:hypothetical protein